MIFKLAELCSYGMTFSWILYSNTFNLAEQRFDLTELSTFILYWITFNQVKLSTGWSLT